MNEKIDEALIKVESHPTNRNPNDRLEMESALISWSNSIKQMLAGRFGKDKVIHLLVIAPVGRESTLSWISTANFASVRAMISVLQTRLRFLEEQRIIIPPEHFGG